MTKREDRARALLLDVLSANGSDRKLAAILAFADEVRAETLREAADAVVSVPLTHFNQSGGNSEAYFTRSDCANAIWSLARSTPSTKPEPGGSWAKCSDCDGEGSVEAIKADGSPFDYATACLTCGGVGGFVRPMFSCRGCGAVDPTVVYRERAGDVMREWCPACEKPEPGGGGAEEAEWVRDAEEHLREVFPPAPVTYLAGTVPGRIEPGMWVRVAGVDGEHCVRSANSLIVVVDTVDCDGRPRFLSREAMDARGVTLARDWTEPGGKVRPGDYDENASDAACRCAKCGSYRPGYPYCAGDPCLDCGCTSGSGP
jgi:hypothetical protein